MSDKFKPNQQVIITAVTGNPERKGTVINRVPSPVRSDDPTEWYLVVDEFMSQGTYAGWRLALPKKTEWKIAGLDDSPKEDVVNNPSHYGGADNPYEVIKVLEAWGLDKDAYLFNVVKYLARAGKKDPAADLQDHEKALYYLKRKIDNMKKESK